MTHARFLRTVAESIFSILTPPAHEPSNFSPRRSRSFTLIPRWKSQAGERASTRVHRLSSGFFPLSFGARHSLYLTFISLTCGFTLSARGRACPCQIGARKRLPAPEFLLETLYRVTVSGTLVALKGKRRDSGPRFAFEGETTKGL